MSYGPFSTSNYLTTASAPVTAMPLSMACRFYSVNTTANQEFIAIKNSGASSDWWGLSARGDVAGDPVQASAGAGGSLSVANSSTGYSANVWNSALGVFSANNSRAVYLNGASKGTNTTNRATSGVAIMTLGIWVSTSPSAPLTDYLAEVAVWTAALTDAEAAVHATGVSPLLIRPQSLVFYAPLIRNLQDVRGGLTITMTGTVAVADHPRIYGL